MRRQIRMSIRNLISDAQEQGISFKDLMKMMREEDKKMKKEEESDFFMINTKKAFKSLENMRYPYKSRVVRLPIFRNKKIQENISRLLFAYYQYFEGNSSDIYATLKDKFEMTKDEIEEAKLYLYKSLSLYYSYNETNFIKDENLKIETLKDFIEEIQSL